MSLATSSIAQQHSLCTKLTLFPPFSENDSVSCLIIKKNFIKEKPSPPHTHNTHTIHTNTQTELFEKGKKRWREGKACLMGSAIQQLGLQLPDLLFIPM